MSRGLPRPDPEHLLTQTNMVGRGQLKIYFGACAGVGKTWSMLQEAHRLRAQGLDVVIGVVETHGRVETAALLEGLEFVTPRLSRENWQTQFDLDKALARDPAMIVMDELAYHNGHQARHPKRWQDIEELLDAGIDVLTTVNVQHLESLNDIVNQITGIRVRETIPDPCFDAAAEVILVDLGADDLIQRLKEGKVYVGERAERAIANFFRKGNLFALRELALRRTADRVDDKMKQWHDSRGGMAKNAAQRDGILLCLGAQTGNDNLVRVTARLVAKLGGEWHAVSVETSKHAQHLAVQQRNSARALSLARRLGAMTTTLSGNDEVTTVLNYAREHKLAKIVMGRPGRGRFSLSKLTYRHFVRRLSEQAAYHDLIFIALDDNTAAESDKRPLVSERDFVGSWRQAIKGMAAAALACMGVTLLGQFLMPGFSSTSMVMIYLLSVVGIALRYGRLPSAFAAIINIVAFDFYFVAPLGQLAVFDPQYLLTFAIMLLVGMITGNLMSGLRYQASVAQLREQRTRHLYQLAGGLSHGRTTEDITRMSQKVIHAALALHCEIWLPDQHGRLQNQCGVSPNQAVTDYAILKWSFEKGQPAGATTDTLPGLPYKIIPLLSGMGCLGVLVIEKDRPHPLLFPEQQPLLETFTTLIADALQRQQLTAREQATRVIAEREELRNALLAALSHDLRTPLTVLFSQAEILTLDLSAEGSPHASQASELRLQIINTLRLVNNILDMARVEDRGFRLRTDWVAIEEICDSALRTLRSIVPQDSVHLDFPTPMVLIQADGPLLERVLINLLENAYKYAGGGQRKVRDSGRN